MSRETRRLLATALMAVIALWVLGRVRYPDRPATTNVPLLTQLAARPAFSDLAAQSADLRSRLGASLLTVRVGGLTAAAFRLRDDTAIALLPLSIAGGLRERSDDGESQPPNPKDSSEVGVPEPVAVDAATGLTVLRVSPTASALAPGAWTPRALDEPRFLMATVASSDAVALRPIFVAVLTPVSSAAWSAPIWAVPQASDLPAGSLLFTEDAQLAGLAVPHEGGAAIVPGTTLLADAQRLRDLPPRARGVLGLETQPLTSAIAAATGARHGVVVAWVDPNGPAARHLRTGDVIEAADGRWLPSPAHWDVRVARLAAGERVVLGVRREREWHDVQLVAAMWPSAPLPLGLTLRRVAGLGSEVVRVDRPSAAAAAGIQPGDLVTLIDGVAAPTPAQVQGSFDAAERSPILIGLARGTTSRVATLHP